MIDPSAFNDIRLSAKYVGMIHEEAMFAVPTPGVATNATVNSIVKQRGDFSGELVASIFQFKSFPMTVAMSQFPRGYSLGFRSGLVYYANMFVGLTIIGYMNIQARDILNGKNPRKLDYKMLAEAIKQGGAGHLFAELLLTDPNAYGGPLELLAGPLLSDLARGFKIMGGTFTDVMDEEKKINDIISSRGTQALKYVQQLTPGRLPYTRAAIDRVIFDTIEEGINKDVTADRRRQRRRERKDKGQDRWWKPGELYPRQAPDVKKVVQPEIDF